VYAALRYYSYEAFSYYSYEALSYYSVLHAYSVCEALSSKCMRPYAIHSSTCEAVTSLGKVSTTVCGLQLLLSAAFSY
jgi:hypothetical protein